MDIRLWFKFNRKELCFFMKKFAIALLAALTVLLCAGCLDRGDMMTTSQSGLAASDGGEASNTDVEPESSGQSGGEDLAQETKEAAFFIAGNNAQGTEVAIDVPSDWQADGDRLIAEGLFTARFAIVLKLNEDAQPQSAIDGIITDDGGNPDEAVALELPGMSCKRCRAVVELGDEIGDGFVYYVFDDGMLAVIELLPAGGAEADKAAAEFEKSLGTLRIAG